MMLQLGIPAPLLPRMVLFDPVFTTVFPVMVPDIMTIFLSSPVRADVSAARVVTVTVVPPLPPVVLNEKVSTLRGRYNVRDTPGFGCVTNGGHVTSRRTPLKSRRCNSSKSGRENGKTSEELHAVVNCEVKSKLLLDQPLCGLPYIAFAECLHMYFTHAGGLSVLNMSRSRKQ